MFEMDFDTKYSDMTKLLAVELVDATALWTHQPSEGRMIKKQIIRSGTSVAANFRAVTRVRSAAEHYAKLCIVDAKADETLFWPEIIKASGLPILPDPACLKGEITELLKISDKANTSGNPKQHKKSHHLTI